MDKNKRTEVEKTKDTKVKLYLFTSGNSLEGIILPNSRNETPVGSGFTNSERDLEYVEPYLHRELNKGNITPIKLHCKLNGWGLIKGDAIDKRLNKLRQREKDKGDETK